MDIRKEIDDFFERPFLDEYLDVLLDIYGDTKDFEDDLTEQYNEPNIINQVKTGILSDRLRLDVYRDLYQIYKDNE